MNAKFMSLLVLFFSGLTGLFPSDAVGQKRVGYVQVVKQATPAINLVSSINTSDSTGVSLVFTATLNGSISSPTGTVSFLDGATLLGTSTLSGNGIANLSVASLPPGVNSITASYGSDTNYAPVTSFPVVALVSNTLDPTVIVLPSSTTITTAQPLSVSVVAFGSQGKSIPTGSVTLSSDGFSSGAMVLASGKTTIVVNAGSLAVGNDTLTLDYAPDAASSSAYQPVQTTASVTVTGAAPSFAVTGANITVAAGSTTGNTAIILVTPSGGFTGSVALTAAITGSPVGARNLPTFSFASTSPVSVGASPATATLIVSTQPASGSTLAYGRGGGWKAASGALLAGGLILCVPLRRNRSTFFGLLVLFAVLAGGTIGCGLVIGFRDGNSSVNGTTPGVYAVAVTGVSGTSKSIGGIALTVK